MMTKDYVEMDWAVNAKCRGSDTRLWYPTSGDLDSVVVETCNSCPVRAVCLEHAMQFNEAHGVWGGTRERERQRMRRQMR